MSGAGDASEMDCIPYKEAKLPYMIEKHLDFMDISEDGCMLLGASNLNGRYWNGNIWYFKNADLAPSNEHCLTGHNCDSGVSSGKFLDTQDKVIVGEDTGTVSIFSLVTFENNDIHFVPQRYATHHDSSVLSIDVTRNRDKAVSGGNDLSIFVWDVESLMPHHVFSPAHARSVTSVKCCEEESSLFASCSLDGCALLWDLRQSSPASVLKNDKICGLTAIAWKNSNIIVGSQIGKVSFLDVRMTKDISSKKVFDRPIHYFSMSKNGLLGVCGDTKTVAVLESTSFSCVYEDDRHTDMVRGLAWHPKNNKLYSCGYDHLVLSHTVPEASPA